jgi:hypothetical protein
LEFDSYLPDMVSCEWIKMLAQFESFFLWGRWGYPLMVWMFRV